MGITEFKFVSTLESNSDNEKEFILKNPMNQMSKIAKAKPPRSTDIRATNIDKLIGESAAQHVDMIERYEALYANFADLYKEHTALKEQFNN